MYEIEPVGLVLPKTDADVQKTLQIAQRHNVAILPRGGGTSLAGQTVGEALILDFSKYMNQVLELDANEEWARVQPGLVQDHFNDYLSPRGFVFGPNTSTSSRATIGGMLGNNSSGSRSIVYGKTVDHVIEVSGYFVDGEPLLFWTCGCGVSRRTHASGFAYGQAPSGAERYRGRPTGGD